MGLAFSIIDLDEKFNKGARPTTDEGRKSSLDGGVFGK